MKLSHPGRIHLSLQYHNLEFDARLKIWKNFLTKGHFKRVQIDVTEEGLRSLARIPLNGRQVSYMPLLD
jgi:hypothetical protein